MHTKFGLLMIVLLLVSSLTGCNRGGQTVFVEENSSEDLKVEGELPSELLPEGDPDEPQIKSPLTGLDISQGLFENRIVSVMIENEFYSRPQSGLDKACIVFEALAEGGITRFLALYLDEEVDEIGPVRSSRPYFIDWAMEFDSVYVHYGASPQAYQDLSQQKIAAIDGIYDGKTFYRDKTRKAPHNAYTKSSSITKAIKDRNFRNDSNFQGMSFAKCDKSIKGRNLTSFSLTYYKGYSVNYVYDSQSKLYCRNINGEPHIDRTTKEQLKVKNIIIQFVETNVIPKDDEGRLNLNNVGSGKGFYISDGKYVDIEWKKDSRSTATTYFLSDDQELDLNPGNTWIQILPQWGEFLPDEA